VGWELAAAGAELEPAAGDEAVDGLELPPQAARGIAAIMATSAAETGVEGMAPSLAHRT
jgi:hypothetical protein